MFVSFGYSVVSDGLLVDLVVMCFGPAFIVRGPVLLYAAVHLVDSYPSLLAS